MAGPYVPPHHRNKASSSNGPQDTSEVKIFKRDDDLFTIEEVEAYFWPKKFAQENVEPSAGSSTSTLHASEAIPDKLSFVILFKGANPRWFGDKIIYVKSNLELLPKAPSSKEEIQSTLDDDGGGTTASAPPISTQSTNSYNKNVVSASKLEDPPPLSPPIPIFQETSKPRPRNIRFAGRHIISHLDILQPNSPELVRMLEQKWSFTDRYGKVRHKERDPEYWKRSMGFKWAVIKFACDSKLDEERGPPNIERREEGRTTSTAGKSVSKMLEELRMGNDRDQGKQGDTNEESRAGADAEEHV